MKLRGGLMHRMGRRSRYATSVGPPGWRIHLCTYEPLSTDLIGHLGAGRGCLWAGLSLLAQRGITGIARRVCGGGSGVSSATASQAAIVMNATTVPALAIGLLLPESLPSVVFATVLITLVVASLVVAFWLVGQLYSAAFGCSVRRGVVGEFVGLATLVLATFAAFFALANLFTP